MLHKICSSARIPLSDGVILRFVGFEPSHNAPYELRFTGIPRTSFLPRFLRFETSKTAFARTFIIRGRGRSPISCTCAKGTSRSQAPIQIRAPGGEMDDCLFLIRCLIVKPSSPEVTRTRVPGSGTGETSTVKLAEPPD